MMRSASTNARERDVLAPLRATGLIAIVLMASPPAQGQRDDLLRMKDGRELRGRVTAERFDRIDFSLRRGATTSFPWEDVESIDYHAPPPFDEAIALDSAGLHENALASFEAVREIKDLRRPLQQETLYHMARLRRRLGDQPGAVETYRELLEVFPQGRYLRQATCGLVLALLAQGEADAAADVLERSSTNVAALARDIRLAAEVDLLKGRVCHAQGRFAEAQGWLEKAESNEALPPQQRAEASLWAARALEAQGHAEQANQRFRQIVDRDATSFIYAAAWNSIADAELEAGRQARDDGRITNALYAYLRGVVLYTPGPGDPRDEYHRALAGAAQCFEYLSQLAKAPREKSFHRQRATELRRQLEND